MYCENDTDKGVLQIAAKLKKLRTDKNSSHEDFAFSNGLPHVSYHRLEKGNNFKIKTLLNILDIHGISLAEFFQDIDKY